MEQQENNSGRGNNSGSGFSQQQFSFNVRIKRHPELQPYIPCDRFGQSSNSNSSGLNNKQPKNKRSVRPIGNKSTPVLLASRSAATSRANSEMKLRESTPLRHDLTYDSSDKVGDALPVPISPIKNTSTRVARTKPKVEPNCQQQQQQQQQPETRASLARKTSIDSQKNESIRTQKSITNTSQKNQQQTQKEQQQQSQPKQEQQMSVNSVSSSRNIRSINNSLFNDNSSIFASPRQPNEDGATSLAEQLSELSVIDPHFQSATSELLVPEHFETSETSNDHGVNFSGRNTSSLLREFHDELKANGFNLSAAANDQQQSDDSATPRVSTTSNQWRHQPTTLEEDLLLAQHEAPSTIWKPRLATSNNIENNDQKSYTPIAENGASSVESAISSQQEDGIVSRRREAEDEERRLLMEEQLREQARIAEEDRKERDKLVESIMSRVNQGGSKFSFEKSNVENPL